MYFITNNEGLIIAASSDFMSKVGSRDICSLASMLNNKQISLQEDNKVKINNKNLEFKYDKTDIHSTIGDLKLYRLLDSNRQTKEAEDDESIAYLKKIKEGSIKKEDNEYEIPDIPVLHHDEKKEIKDESKQEEIKDELEEFKSQREKEIKEIENAYKQSIAKINPEDKTIEIKQESTPDNDIVSIIEDIEVKDSKDIKIPDIPKEAIAQITPEAKSIKEEIKEEVKEKKEQLQKEIDNLVKETKIDEVKIPAIPKEAIEETKEKISNEFAEVKEEITEKKEEVKEKLEEVKQDVKDSLKTPAEKVIKVKDAISEKIDDVKEEIKETKEEVKEKVISVAKEIKEEVKIPAIPKEAIEESAKSVKEEIEEDSYKTVRIKTTQEESQNQEGGFVAKEYISEAKEKAEDKIEHLVDEAKEVKEEIKDEIKEKIDAVEESVEEKKKKLFSSNLFPWGKKRDEKKEETTATQSPVVDDLDDLVILDSHKEPEALKVDKKESFLDKIEEKAKDVAKEVKEEIKEITPTLKDEKSELKKSVESLEKELSITQEPIESEKTSTIAKAATAAGVAGVAKVLADKLQNDKPVNTNEIIEKIINTQVDAIDLQKNADKLNIDLNSYKMLLNSYLGEIDKYIPQLKESNTQVIDMLIDAGQLLSLDTITSKLSALKIADESDRASKVKEIDIFTKLLKTKAQNSTISALKDEPKAEEKKEQIVNENKSQTQEVKTAQEEIAIKEPLKVAQEPTTQKEVLEAVEESLPETKMVKIEDTYGNNEPESTDPIIEITTAEELLDIITPVDVHLNPKIAAEELNLPEELIVEFIYDFLKQSKEHLPILVDSYLTKDIEKVQSTAHMLKGAANNLRLNKIADNLYKIQKENDLKNDKYLIKKFVAQIKGLEIELKNLGE